MLLLIAIIALTEASNFKLPKLEIPKKGVQPNWQLTSLCPQSYVETHHFTPDTFLIPRCQHIEYFYSILRVHIECASEDGGEGDACPEDKALKACGQGGPCDLSAVYVTSYTDFALQGMTTGPGTHKWDMKPVTANQHNDYVFSKGTAAGSTTSYDLLEKNEEGMLAEKCGTLVVNFEEKRSIGSTASTDNKPTPFYINLDLRKESCADDDIRHITEHNNTEAPFDPIVHIRTHCAEASDLGSDLGKAKICITILHSTTMVKWRANPFGLVVSRKVNTQKTPEKLAEDRLKQVSKLQQGGFSVVKDQSDQVRNPVENYRCGQALYYYGVISMRLVCEGEANEVCSKECTNELCKDGVSDEWHHCDNRVDIVNQHSNNNQKFTAWHMQNQKDPAFYKGYVGRDATDLVYRNLTGWLSHNDTQQFALATGPFDATKMKECATFMTEIWDEDTANSADQSTIYDHEKLLNPNCPTAKIPLPRFGSDSRVREPPTLGDPFWFLETSTANAECNGKTMKIEVTHVVLLLSITEPDGARVCNDGLTESFFNCEEQKVYDTTKAEAYLRQMLAGQIFLNDDKFKVTMNKITTYKQWWLDYRGAQTRG